jgi:hypothetical protein
MGLTFFRRSTTPNRTASHETSSPRGARATYDFCTAGSGTNYGAASSMRWKHDIAEIGDALGMVNRLRGVYCNWDEDHGGHRDIGMDYSKLTPLLVEAVRELSAENQSLKQQIARLDERLRTLE